MTRHAVLTGPERQRQADVLAARQREMDRTAQQQAAVNRQRQANADALAKKRAEEQAERDRRFAELQAEHEKQLQAEAAGTVDRLKQEARESYLRSGGSPSDFERDWPAMKSRLLADATAADIAARRARAHRVKF